MKNLKNPPKTNLPFAQGSWILVLGGQYKHSVPLTSGCCDCWPCWAMRSLGMAQESDKTWLWGCSVPGQLRWVGRKCCSCWGLQAHAASSSAAEWQLMIILCGVWVKQFLQTLLYSCQNKEFWCCFGLAFNGIVIEKTRVYKQSLISWKQHSSKTLRGNLQTCHL